MERMSRMDETVTIAAVAILTTERLGEADI
jgi:hypothetical protein